MLVYAVKDMSLVLSTYIDEIAIDICAIETVGMGDDQEDDNVYEFFNKSQMSMAHSVKSNTANHQRKKTGTQQ